MDVNLYWGYQDSDRVANDGMSVQALQEKDNYGWIVLKTIEKTRTTTEFLL
jgi:hypothetical protein